MRVLAIGPPPMWARKPGFGTLLHIILEQQVSLASAQAAYDKLLALGNPLTPERFLAYDDGTLRAAGFSWQKAHYGRILAPVAWRPPAALCAANRKRPIQYEYLFFRGARLHSFVPAFNDGFHVERFDDVPILLVI